MLLSNGEKISDLCGQLENVKVEQDELDQELDRVNAQQVELEGIFSKSLLEFTCTFSNFGTTWRSSEQE